jgi:nitroreductase
MFSVLNIVEVLMLTVGSDSPTTSTRSALLDRLASSTRRPRPSAQGQPPTEDELEWLLRAATAVPDHGRLHPWRFVVITGQARHRLGGALAADRATTPDTPVAAIDKARAKAFAAPCLIVVIASPNSASNVPEWEQVASAACCGYALVLAADALGLGAVWKSTPLRDGAALRALCAMTEGEQLLGWVNVGSLDDTARTEPRSPADISALTTMLT